MKISEHAKKRYIERINKKEGQEAERFATTNGEMVEEHLTKLFENATLVYSGASFIDNQGKVDVLLKDTWILIYDNRKDTLVTIYSIDLGIGKEFNEQYVSGLLERISLLNSKREDEIKRLNTIIERLDVEISEDEAVIQQLRKQIKERDEAIEYNKRLKKIRMEEVEQSGQELRDLVGILIKKKVF